MPLPTTHGSRALNHSRRHGAAAPPLQAAPSPRYEIVVSAENNLYMAWQSMVFHYSCTRRLCRVPTIVVHGDGSRLVAGFHAIERRGGQVRPARSFRSRYGKDYPPRNSVGTLLSLQSDADYLVLCDPDMIFAAPTRFEQYPLRADQVGVDRTSYITVQVRNRAFLAAVCRRVGVSLRRLERMPPAAGVPHIIPAPIRLALGREWLHCLDCCLQTSGGSRVHGGEAMPWVASMWAIQLAILRLGLDPVVTDFAVSNYEGDALYRPAGDGQGGCMIHYAYGDDRFNKRSFCGSRARCEKVWGVRPGMRSIHGVVCREISLAAGFYGMGRGLARPGRGPRSRPSRRAGPAG